MTTDTSQDTTTTSGGAEVGNDVAADYTDADATVTDTDNANVVTADGSETTTDTSVDVTTTTGGSETGNEIAGDFTDSTSTATDIDSVNIGEENRDGRPFI